jgi:hypothetical protein
MAGYFNYSKTAKLVLEISMVTVFSVTALGQDENQPIDSTPQDSEMVRSFPDPLAQIPTWEELRKMPIESARTKLNYVVDLTALLEASQGTNSYAQLNRPSPSMPQMLLETLAGDSAFANDSIRRAGARCFFGLRVSRYIESNGKTVCPRPENTTCTAANGAAGFSCNDFGISEIKSCEPYAPLTNLTERCVVAIKSKVDRLPQVPAGREGKRAYSAVVANLKAAVNDFYAVRGNASMSLREFCQRANANAQPSECRAVQSLMESSSRQACAAEVSGTGTDLVTGTDSFNACLGCRLNDITSGKKPSKKYLQLVEVMANQCLRRQSGRAATTQQIQDEMTKMITSIGFCESYGSNPLPDAEFQRFKTAQEGGGYLDGYPGFEKAFGMNAREAQDAFCSTAATGPNRQKQFENAMKNARGAANGENGNRMIGNTDRARSGWERCDGEIQVLSGRPIISGVTRQTLVQLKNEYGFQTQSRFQLTPGEKKLDMDKLIRADSFQISNNRAVLPHFRHLGYSLQELQAPARRVVATPVARLTTWPYQTPTDTLGQLQVCSNLPSRPRNVPPATGSTSTK